MSKKRLVEYVVYIVLASLMLVFAIYGLGIGFSADWAVSFERNIVRSLSLADFDLFVVSQLGLSLTGAVLIGIMVYLDELGIRQGLRKK